MVHWLRSIVIPGLTIVLCGCIMVTSSRYSYVRVARLTRAGSIGGFQRIKRKLMMSIREEFFSTVQGSTDSEWAFAIFLNELANLGCTPSEQKVGGFGHAKLRTAMMNTIFAINKLCKESGEQEPSLLNFAVTDGEAVVASRYVSSSTEEAASLFFRY